MRFIPIVKVRFLFLYPGNKLLHFGVRAYGVGIVKLALQLFFRPDGMDLPVADPVEVFAGLAAAAFGNKMVPVDAVALPHSAFADGADAYNNRFMGFTWHELKI